MLNVSTVVDPTIFGGDRIDRELERDGTHIFLRNGIDGALGALVGCLRGGEFGFQWIGPGLLLPLFAHRAGRRSYSSYM